MDDYEGFHEMDTPEQSGAEGETPVNMNAAAPADTPAETPAEAAPAANPAEPAYYELPPERRGAYSDAGYIPASDAGAMPKCYPFAAASEPRARKEKAPRRGMHPAAIVALCVVCAMLGGLVAGLAPRWMTHDTAEAPAEVSENVEETRSAPAAATSGSTDTVFKLSGGDGAKTVTTNKVATEEMSATDIYYQRALDQVVGVKTEITYTNYFGYTTKAAVSGSGFIISEDGYILTNYHVIEDAVNGGYDVQVLTYDGTEYTAQVIGYEEDNDVALLKIDATGLNAAILGDSDAMQVGEQVYAVGNPTGELEYSMTEGIVSAKDREITAGNASTGRVETVRVFQTTAAINGGNSGGPVYNSRGEVIGIVVAKRVSTEIEGLAFAIPINDAVRIAKDLINDGYVRGKAYMGAQIGTVTASAARYYGLVQGAIVSGVVEGSAAEKAGLKASDIIVAIDGKEIASRDELESAKKGYNAGDSAVLKVYREGQYIELTIVFDELTPEALEAGSGEDEESPAPEQNGSGYAGGYEDFFREFFGGSPFGN